MDAATTALVLTAPVAAPCAASGVYAVRGMRRRTPARTPLRTPVPAGAGPTPPDLGAAPVPAGLPHGSVVVPQGSAVVPPGSAVVPPSSPVVPPGAAVVPPVVVLGCGALMAATLPRGGALSAFGGLLRADALTVWLLLVVGAVALIACGTLPAYLAGEREGAQSAAVLHLLVQAFLGAMCLAVLTANLGVLWVAVEATTIVTTFLVGHRRTRRSVEAAWKYVVICSAGIALAFLGTVLVYYAARQAGIDETHALDWPTLVAGAGRLDPAVTRLAISLVVLGFGAKAGLAPLHAWLPDAYGQAPAPVSALMSGALAPVAFAAVLRYEQIAAAALGTGLTRGLLTGMALITLALAAALLLAQRDYRRMLAYSGMEHMSLIALGAAIGTPLARAALLLHIAGHGLAKAVAFCASGHVLRLTGTPLIGRVRGLLARLPWLGGAFGLAVAALLGFPPFSLFASELGIVRAGFGAGMGWVTAVALLLVLVVFGALAVRTARMLLGPARPARSPGPDPAPGPDRDPEPAPGPWPGAVWPLGLGLATCAVLGLTTGPLTDLLHDAAAVIGGH
ncbi:proton-conducting transporter membrane subunit [Streptomyces sp. NPDC101160]|uniref:proton-conducting transporter transmembrane domain-containing protein n=1 Tax=Streptomyces sp. NPDC101160 TaxID=3366118 RepID=UPI0038279EB1